MQAPFGMIPQNSPIKGDESGCRIENKLNSQSSSLDRKVESQFNIFGSAFPSLPLASGPSSV